MKKLKTFEEAKRLSIQKWEWILKNSGEKINYDKDKLKKENPELVGLIAECGFCDYFLERDSIVRWIKTLENGTSCGKCPLNNLSFFDKLLGKKTKAYDTACMHTRHLYYRAINGNNKRKHALKLLKIISNSHE